MWRKAASSRRHRRSRAVDGFERRARRKALCGGIKKKAGSGSRKAKACTHQSEKYRAAVELTARRPFGCGLAMSYGALNERVVCDVARAHMICPVAAITVTVGYGEAAAK